MNIAIKRKWTWTQIFIASLGAYLLSSGPFVGFYAAHSMISPPEWLSAFYWPLTRFAAIRRVGLPLALYFYVWEMIFGGGGS